MKTRLLAVSLILFASLTAAQNTDQSVDADPGWVKADSPIYGFEVALDNALVSAGFASAGEVAKERASEVRVAVDRNNTRAAERAVEQFNSTLVRADNSQREALTQAESVMKNVSERVSEEADFGISNALENVEIAKNRVPDRLTSGGGGALPDIKMPGGGRDVESPVDDSEG